MEADLILNLLLKWQRDRSCPEIVINVLWVMSTIINPGWRQLHHELGERDDLFNGIKAKLTETLESANINLK